MSHPVSGYGKPLGEIGPNTLSSLLVTSGFGWTQNADESFSDSFADHNVDNYAVYDNWVKVQVQGSVLFPVEALTFKDYFGEEVVTVLTAMVGIGSYLKYIGCMGGSGDSFVDGLKKVYGLGYLLAAVFAIVTAVAFLGMVQTLPSGLRFPNDDESLYTTRNPIVVQVTRFKKGANLGMWNFQYGSAGVHARSAAHAFQEHDYITIKPVLVESIKDLDHLLGAVAGSVTDVNWSNPFGIVTFMQGALCMGLAFVTISNIASLKMCDMAGLDCAEDYLEQVLASFILFGPGAALEFMAYQALCREDGGFLNPQAGDVNMDSSGLGLDTSEWFYTGHHLFETELYNAGFIE